MTTSTPIPPRPPRPFLTAPPRDDTITTASLPYSPPSSRPVTITTIDLPITTHTTYISNTTSPHTPLTTSPDQLRPNVRHAPPRSSIPLPQNTTRKE
ncbi:proline-rich receptor-like protein kinase PERK2 [Iris pallida]|uniref:Proline-rich receptor-like protein kinase PERK2 n=1 Tax=Iris pallida TaxID=29817 RepID=A0AAX6G288_IRIPA|nr:proline-rich receptor-like protein kinase PERK2 [Iris pallida]